MPPQHRTIGNLDASLDALQLADDLNDEDAVWAAMLDFLTELSKCEERVRTADPLSYFRRRDASANGRAAGGLIWARGLIEHHEAEFQVHLFRPFAIASEDRAPQQLVYRQTSEAPMVFVDDVIWPERRNLPTPGRRYKAHQRDSYYDLLIAGRPLIEPLWAARNYFASESRSLGDRNVSAI